MNESVPNDLIHLGINFGFVMFFFGFVYGVVACLIKCYNNDTNHHHGTSDDHVTITIMECPGIKPSVLRSIPIVDFNSKDFKDNVECVVCLSDLVDGDKARVLPSCNHLFHADCIDSWFKSNSTCPICRKRVVGLVQRGTRQELDEGLTQNHDQSSEHPTFPTDPRPGTDTAVVEDRGEANEARPDLTAVVVDIPTKT